MKIEVKGIVDVKSFNAQVRKASGKFPSQLEEGTQIVVYPSRDIKADDLLALVVEIGYLVYKNKVIVNAMTKRGIVPLDGAYLQNFVSAKNIRFMNFKAPTINGKVNWVVFKNQMQSIENSLSMKTEIDINLPAKPGSSYNGDFLSLCDKEEATTVSNIHYTNVYRLPVGVNLIVPDNSFFYVWVAARNRMTNYAINGVCLSKTYKESLDSLEKDIEVVYYLFQYDEKIFYDDFNRITFQPLVELAQAIVQMPEIFWFTGNYEQEKFMKYLEYFLKKYFKDIKDDVLVDTLSYIDFQMEEDGRYILMDTFYEDSYNEGEEDE